MKRAMAETKHIAGGTCSNTPMKRTHQNELATLIGLPLELQLAVVARLDCTRARLRLAACCRVLAAVVAQADHAAQYGCHVTYTASCQDGTRICVTLQVTVYRDAPRQLVECSYETAEPDVAARTLNSLLRCASARLTVVYNLYLTDRFLASLGGSDCSALRMCTESAARLLSANPTGAYQSYRAARVHVHCAPDHNWHRHDSLHQLLVSIDQCNFERFELSFDVTQYGEPTDLNDHLFLPSLRSLQCLTVHGGGTANANTNADGLALVGRPGCWPELPALAELSLYCIGFNRGTQFAKTEWLERVFDRYPTLRRIGLGKVRLGRYLFSSNSPTPDSLLLQLSRHAPLVVDIRDEFFIVHGFDAYCNSRAKLFALVSTQFSRLHTLRMTVEEFDYVVDGDGGQQQPGEGQNEFEPPPRVPLTIAKIIQATTAFLENNRNETEDRLCVGDFAFTDGDVELIQLCNQVLQRGRPDTDRLAFSMQQQSNFGCGKSLSTSGYGICQRSFQDVSWVYEPDLDAAEHKCVDWLCEFASGTGLRVRRLWLLIQQRLPHCHTQLVFCCTDDSQRHCYVIANSRCAAVIQSLNCPLAMVDL